MERRPDYIKAAQIFDDTIIDLFIVTLWHKRPEHLVPDNEDTRIIGIQILWIGRMVDAVVGWRVHHGFKPARHPFDRFGVNPELIDEVKPTNKDHHFHRKADEEKRHTEKEGERDKAGPRLPERG